MIATITELRKTAEAIYVMSMEEATEHDATLLGRIRRASLLHKGYYTCTLDGVRTLYIRRDCN